jgi:hypothetical protein
VAAALGRIDSGVSSVVQPVRRSRVVLGQPSESDPAHRSSIWRRQAHASRGSPTREVHVDLDSRTPTRDRGDRRGLALTKFLFILLILAVILALFGARSAA